MATHFYFNGHTYEIEPASLTWADADANATALAWDDEDRSGTTVSSYLANIGSAAESAAILKNLKASVEKGSTIAADGGGTDHLWIGTTDNGINLSGQINALAGSNLLLSIVEWDGLIGTAASETLIGTTSNDIIDGNAGNDTIKGGDGDDTIYMGDGNDRVYTGSGNNFVYAETTTTDSDDGDDMIIAGHGDNFLAPGNGNDTVKTGNGNNTVIGGSGNDKITTGSGNDTINIDGYYADDGVGGEGDDTISTGAGDDYIVAGSGNDTVKAGNGNDHIVLGEDFDTVWGGNGNDIFEFNKIPENSTAPTSGSSGSSGGTNFVTGTAGSSTSSGSTTGSSGSGSGSGSTPTVTTIKDFNAGTNGSVVDQLVLDSAVFEALSTTALPDGLATTNFLKGQGITGPSANETGIDDYLIFDTRSGCLYYDADGNQTDSETILIAVLKGKMTDFNLEDIFIG
jgi:serralysin